jgi:pimeloyl-ACP methyl ester carboxylesterase
MPKKLASIGAGKIIGLDARPDRLDLRDLPFRPSVVNLEPRFPDADKISQFLPTYLRAGLILNQGKEGACTGFGLAATINFQLWARAGYPGNLDDKVSSRMLYKLAKYYDEWPDEDYSGSSCRGALKGWQKHGVCSETLWDTEPLDGWDKDAVSRPVGIYYRINKQSVVDMQSAIRTMNAIYVSATVHAGWGKVKKVANATSHEQLPLIEQKTEILGGHAFSIVGYNERGFIVQNSWGADWGASGFAVLSYQDWVENGSDAWVLGMGVPVAQANAASPKYRVHSRRPAGSAPVTGWQEGHDPLRDRKGAWSLEEGYRHTLVTGNNGVLLNRMPHLEGAEANARYIAYTLPRAALADKRDLLVYLHGGLGSEESSLDRIRIMGPWLNECGLYPLFVTWKSGWSEILRDMVEDKAHQMFGAPPAQGIGERISEAWDRGIEMLTRDLLVRSMWNEMKENIASGMAKNADAGLSALATQLSALAGDVPGLRIHLVGHSAGSIIAGHLLSRFAESGTAVESCTLYAPACDVAFANRHFRQLPVNKLTIHTLSDKLELDDTTGPYRKSLLYLVSRALERLHKTPILGMQNAHDPARITEEFWHADTLDSLRDWQQFYPRAGVRLLENAQVSNGARSVKACHGCFDNAVAILGDTVGRLTGHKPAELPKVVLDF